LKELKTALQAFLKKGETLYLETKVLFFLPFSRDLFME